MATITRWHVVEVLTLLPRPQARLVADGSATYHDGDDEAQAVLDAVQAHCKLAHVVRGPAGHRDLWDYWVVECLEHVEVSKV
jgi:hypothetical protein